MGKYVFRDLLEDFITFSFNVEYGMICLHSLNCIYRSFNNVYNALNTPDEQVADMIPTLLHPTLPLPEIW